jgi:Zn-dependent protease with chaperone function
MEKVYNVSMKKFIVIIALLLLSSLAYGEEKPYVIPKDILNRSVPIFHEVAKCFNYSSLDIKSELFIQSSKEVNAWIDENYNVYLTEGVFKYDNDVVTFAIAHELAHAKLNHIKKQKNVSYATTGFMMVLNAIIPGSGLLNYVVNPAVTNNFSKTQELDADRMASEGLINCFNISIEKQVHVCETLQKESKDGGGFWARHPPWNERIENIKRPRH